MSALPDTASLDDMEKIEHPRLYRATEAERAFKSYPWEAFGGRPMRSVWFDIEDEMKCEVIRDESVPFFHLSHWFVVEFEPETCRIIHVGVFAK